MFSSFAGAIGGAAVAAQFKQATGLDLQQDVFSWIGDTGVFVRGADMATLDGALVISSTDDARAESAFNKFVGLAGQADGRGATPVEGRRRRRRVRDRLNRGRPEAGRARAR